MSEPIPIACTLTRAGLGHRVMAWRKLLSSGLVDRRRVPGGVRLTARPGAEAALMELVELERECCAWIRVESAGERSVTLTSERAAGEAVLAQLFLRLPSVPPVFALMGVVLAAPALVCVVACALPVAVVAGLAARALAVAPGALLTAAVAALVAGAACVWMWRRNAAAKRVVPAEVAVKGER